jgi:hypothetical protein
VKQNGQYVDFAKLAPARAAGVAKKDLAAVRPAAAAEGRRRTSVARAMGKKQRGTKMKMGTAPSFLPPRQFGGRSSFTSIRPSPSPTWSPVAAGDACF